MGLVSHLYILYLTNHRFFEESHRGSRFQMLVKDGRKDDFLTMSGARWLRKQDIEGDVIIGSLQ